MTQQPATEQDLLFLRQAIELARAARAHGAHPFGSLIVDEHGHVLDGLLRIDCAVVAGEMPAPLDDP